MGLRALQIALIFAFLGASSLLAVSFAESNAVPPVASTTSPKTDQVADKSSKTAPVPPAKNQSSISKPVVAKNSTQGKTESTQTPDATPAKSGTSKNASSSEAGGDYTENPDDAEDFGAEEDEFDNFDDEDVDFGPGSGDFDSSSNATSTNTTSGKPTSATSGNTTEVPVVKLADDISAKGNCSADIATFCKGLAPGGAALLTCLSNQIIAGKVSNAEKVGAVSVPCKGEIRAFKIEMYKDISMDAKLEKECKTDIKKYCDDDFLYPEPGNILACLREVNQVDTMTEGCKHEVLRAQMDAAKDFKMDPQLNELCSADAEKLCKDVAPGEGRIQSCLRASRTKLSWDCQAELFRQEVENVADIRLNVRLFQSCLTDKKKFCPDVAPGDARVKDCLEAHRLDSDFSASCKEEFDQMMERRASDFRLDQSLRKYCKSDISEICYPDAEDVTDIASWDAKVIQCLQDYRDELKKPKCRQQVRKLTKRASEDYRFDKPFADACHDDRTSICKDVPDGMAQVLKCLQDHRDNLKDGCKSALFDQEVRMAEEIDFDFSMKKACAHEAKSICKDIPSGHAAVIKCLQEKVDDSEMGSECKAEVKRNEIRAAQDYRLNYRLNKACYNDVQKICIHVCDKSLQNGSLTCGGAVLKCLSDNKANLTSPACKNEIFVFQKQEVADVRLDVPLQLACRADLQKLCPKVSKDHTRTLACLRSNRDSLSKGCKAEELRFSEMEASDIRLTPTLMNACGQELHVFCKEVPSSEGHAFKCLQNNLDEVGMGAACKVEVNIQEARQASDYRLDASVKAVCSKDAEAVCSNVDRDNLGHAIMLKCFVKNYKKLSGSCQTEISYAVRSALFQYRLGADLTLPCDPEVKQRCQSEEVKDIGGSVIGIYGQCLMGTNLTSLNPECRKLVKVMAKKGAYVSGKIDDDKLQDAISQLAALQAAGSGGGFVLSGWVAIFALLVILGLFLAAGYAVYIKYYSPTARYTLVVKSGDV